MGTATVQAMSHSLRYYIDQAAPGGQQITQLIFDHKAVAIFGVIAMEEVGIPIPLPGDVFIAYAGHLIARGAIDPLSAFLSVVVGSIVGASVLYWLGRRFGQPFVKRYGPFMHAKPGRVQKLEGWFKRWGPLVVIFGRHVPGLRIVISLAAGLFGVSYPVFVGSVAISSSAWAALFLAVGIRLDRDLGPYMNITPLHLLPSTIFISASIIYALILKRRAARAELAGSAATAEPAVLAQSQAHV